jgi:hypothetical protein
MVYNKGNYITAKFLGRENCMANEKKPSIYDDRGGIGSSAELDEYGVWVKSEPLDISSGDESTGDTQGISDLTISDLDSSLEDLPLLEDDPTSELNLFEDSPLEGFDLSKKPDSAADILPPDAIGSDGLDTLSLDDGVLDITNLPDLPDLEDEDEGEELQVEDILAADPDFMADKDSPLVELSKDSVAPVIEKAAGEEALPSDEEALPADVEPVPEEAIAKEDTAEDPPEETTEVPTIDATYPEEAPPKEAAHQEPSPASGPSNGADFTDVFMENFLDESPFDDDEEPPKEPAAKAPEPVVEATVDAQPAEPEAVAEPDAPEEAIAEPAETEAAVGEQPAEPEAATKPDEPTNEDALETAEALELTEAFDSAIETTDTAETIDEAVKEPAAEQPVTENLEKEESMPTVEENPSAQASALNPVQAAASNLSTELLLRIAEELSSIRQELSTLKQDFLVSKSKEQPEAQSPTHGSSDVEAVQVEISADTEAAPQEGGFFDDTEDEKIALSGDELDNILNSANFIEEVGEGVVEDQPLEETAVDEVVVLDPDKDSDELQRLREEGVEPITAMPEDTSLLEAAVDVAEAVFEDTIIEDVSEADIDLSNAVIEEPDLSGKIKENPIQEPELEDISFEDISLDLPSDNSDREIPQPETAAEEQLIEIPQEAAEVSGVEEVSEVEVVSVGAPAEESAPVVVSDEAVAESSPAVEPAAPSQPADLSTIPSNVKQELKTVLSYMDQLLESLPEDKIEEFAASKYFDTYKKLFAELGLV